MNEVIAKIVREWKGWSKAERRRMDEIVEEVLDHCRNGTGNPFVAAWCRKNLMPFPSRMAIAFLDSISVPFPAPREMS